MIVEQQQLRMPSRRQPLLEISENHAMNSPNIATNNRRKSGRAVKAPDKFQPEANTTPEPTNGKRKRAAADASEDVENEVEEDEEESEDEEVSADEEEVRATKKRAKQPKKPAVKKAKTNGTKSHTPEPIHRLPTRPKKSKKVTIADANAEGLYGKLL